MTTEQITEAQVQQLADVIRGAKATEAATAAEASAQQTFCSVWSNVKTGLETLRVVLAAVPGVGVLATAAISIVIAAGDAAQRALCQ